MRNGNQASTIRQDEEKVLIAEKSGSKMPVDGENLASFSTIEEAIEDLRSAGLLWWRMTKGARMRAI